MKRVVAFLSLALSTLSVIVLCSLAVPAAISAPGSNFVNGAYQPCAIKLTDKYGDSMAFSLTPQLKQVTDNYTGATVQVWGLPGGQKFSGTPPTTSDLDTNDLQYCQNNSSTAVSGLSNNITLSAVWAVDPLARDVVYMGLDPKNMPRVNVNLSAAPSNPPDPAAVSWTPNAAITFTEQNGQIVQVNWTAALVGPNQTLQYTLYVKQGTSWIPQTSCNQSQTSCNLNLGQSASVYVLAQNVTAPQPYPQSTLCYPAANPCPPVVAEDQTKTRLPKQ